MKPYGREKKIIGGGQWKIDYHIHLKHKFQNWWEDIAGYLSRSAMKHKLRKEIEKELDENN